MRAVTPILCIPMLTIALFTIAKRWKQPKCPLIDNWINKCGIYVQGTVFQPSKGREF